MRMSYVHGTRQRVYRHTVITLSYYTKLNSQLSCAQYLFKVLEDQKV